MYLIIIVLQNIWRWAPNIYGLVVISHVELDITIFVHTRLILLLQAVFFVGKKASLKTTCIWVMLLIHASLQSKFYQILMCCDLVEGKGTAISSICSGKRAKLSPRVNMLRLFSQFLLLELLLVFMRSSADFFLYFFFIQNKYTMFWNL